MTAVDALRPPYELVSMAGLAGIAPNGYDVVSTFSGCGGSCLGFRLAGYRTLWASEFVEIAADTYAANYPDVPLDRRDIRLVQPEEILEATGLQVGELDVLEGSPPCAPFSTSGRGAEGWGRVRSYSDVKQRVDDLFGEYVRLLRGLQPRAFVAENVAGLVRGVAKGYFVRILGALEDAGYRVEARVLDAEWLGVPQARRRTIFIGVRSDLGQAPRFPRPLPYRYTLRDALKPFLEDGVDPEVTWHARWDTRPSLKRAYARTLPGESSERYFNMVRNRLDQPAATVTATVHRGASVCHPLEPRWFTIPELRRVCGFPPDFVLTGDEPRQAERLGRAVPPPMMRAVAESVREVLDLCPK